MSWEMQIFIGILGVVVIWFGWMYLMYRMRQNRILVVEAEEASEEQLSPYPSARLRVKGVDFACGSSVQVSEEEDVLPIVGGLHLELTTTSEYAYAPVYFNPISTPEVETEPLPMPERHEEPQAHESRSSSWIQPYFVPEPSYEPSYSSESYNRSSSSYAESSSSYSSSSYSSSDSSSSSSSSDSGCSSSD